MVEHIFVAQKRDKVTKKYQFPASFRKAKLHQKAVKFGYNAPRTKMNKGIEEGGDYGGDIPTP